MGKALQEHLQEQEWHFVLYGALFLWHTAKVQVEAKAIVEILADLQTQRQQIPPGHCTVGHTAGNKAQIPATGPDSFITASGTKHCILLQIPG